MSTQELRLRYFLQLASNIGVTAKREAQEFERSQEQMSRSTQQTNRATQALERTLGQLSSNTSMERQVRYIDRLASGMERAHAKAKQLKEVMAQGVQNLPEVAAMGAASYYGGKAILTPPVRAYADLEQATVGLKTAMLDANLKVDKSFGLIAKKAEELGNKLPGTSKDFFQSATELIRQGVAPDQVAGGALEASAKFGVLMKMDQGQSAKTIAKVREAYGLSGTQLPQMADLMQRAAFASGIDPQDFLDVARYAAPTYNTMKLTGLQNARQLLAVQGMAAGVGLESTSFGTNFAQMLSRLSQVDQRVARKSPEAREVKSLLDKHGIDLSFYNKSGEFSGIENMLKELAKMRGLSTVDKQHIAKVMFGDEAGRPAQILIDKGLESYRDMLGKMDSQASLDQRLDSVLTTLAAKLEAFGGTVENVMARMATQIGNGAKPVLDWGNGVLGNVGDFMQEHPGAGTAGLAGATMLGAAGAWRGSGALFGLVRGMRGGAPAAAAAAAAQAVHNPFRGLGVSMPAPVAAPSMLARLGAAGRYLGPAAAVGMLGLDSYNVVTDDNLTAMGKAKGLSGAVSGAAGAWAGAKLGMLAGSAVLPGWGTIGGGLVGGALGYMGGKGLSDWTWGSDPKRDFVKLTAPNGSTMGGVPGGGQTTIQVGQGTLQVDVRVMADGSFSTSSSVTRPMELLKVEAGSTNPGSFAGLGGGGLR
jgi:TP901 family phage tail tape measure protein